ncbi:phosphate transport system regulatory protein PhoU [Citricoccus zhacaiensis]|uniref:Phosphate-specific transport system accessory protein PhoU n=1 Tax=Citricoccus zhacaiensis TaxID=489142 RepID=A0ABQ2LXJ8_9MICC|nr:phosphate signaling complex protein PhoU [Citricoccus zhacaiensis]GGO44348.1 phosphate transport system regulatory protein PhoU [Citricoccus zhacaiensis]
MRELFHADLKSLGDQLTEIAGLVREAMDKARVSFEEADVELAETVITNDARIDYLQTALDEKAIELLALQGPVAADLRTVVAALRMSSSLERMGDLARHIAQLARRRFPDLVVPESAREDFRQMAEYAVAVATEVEQLLSTHDLAHASTIVRLNVTINDLHAKNFTSVAAPEWNASAATTADVTLASRFLERFADHGVSVARKVTYLATGEWEPVIAID